MFDQDCTTTDAAPMTQAVACDTGIAPDDMYRMSSRYVDYLSTCTWHLNTHRAFHVLLHRTCRGLPEWSENVIPPEEGVRDRAIRLRHTVGLGSDNGNRNLRPGIEALQASGMFEWLEFIHDGEFVAWRFRDEVLQAILENGIYGLMDASALARLKSPIDYQIFCQVSLARRMRKPRFTFTLEQAGLWTGREEARWSDISGDVITALRLCCAHYGLTACVLLDRRGILRGIDKVEVRLHRPGSLWTAGDMAKLNLETEKCVVLDGSGHRPVRRADYPALVGRLRDAHWRLSQLG